MEDKTKIMATLNALAEGKNQGACGEEINEDKPDQEEAKSSKGRKESYYVSPH